MKMQVTVVTLFCAPVLAVACGACSASAPARAGSGGARPAASADSPDARAATSHAPPTSSAGASQPRRCPTDSLRIVTAPGSGEAMGTVRFDLAFTNAGSVPCKLVGYPTVSFTTAQHAQIGQSAVRAPATPDLVVLAPGRVATAQLQIDNPDNMSARSCKPTAAAFIKVFPPGATVPGYVPLRPGAKVCAAAGAGPVVWPVVAGSRAGF